jgi:acetoacetyl-CoA synthetase
MSAFSAKVENLTGQKINDYAHLHQWSVSNIADFWSLVWEDSNIIGSKGERILVDQNKMTGAKFFPDGELNFAENLLRKNNDEIAIIFRREDGLREEVSWKQLHNIVSRTQQAMIAFGIKKGDCIAAIAPNSPHTIATMLAASSLGAIWASCSPDFGEQAVIDRFSQINPKLLFVCDGYWYNGKEIDLKQRLSNISAQLDVEKIIVMPFMGKEEKIIPLIKKGISYHQFIADFKPKTVKFTRLSFSHPLYILFSSGTTGIPKCIVHSAGGTLLQHAKEHRLHCGIQENDRVFYFTTCGWMMWNWLASALACGATIMLYDGSPFYPNDNVLIDYVAEEKCNFFGTSAKYIDTLRNKSLSPIKTHDLSTLRIIASTGSALAPENFKYVYSHIKKDAQLISISGGTDIVGCFVGGVPWMPVYAGEIQGALLGMNVSVWDDQGNPTCSGKGELVCTSPFPSMPIGFWNDNNNEKYHRAYFNRFNNVWCQGDFAEKTPHNGFIIHGRSDATLNPGGVRIGTAEIYNQVEKLPEIEEGLCVGQDWENDSRIILFVRLAPGKTLNDELKNRIRHQIRYGASPRHVPAIIIGVADLPRTKSGKIAELSVRDIIHGKEATNLEALMNPESLKLFKNIPEIENG